MYFVGCLLCDFLIHFEEACDAVGFGGVLSTFVMDEIKNTHALNL